MPSGALQAAALLVICTTVQLHRKAESMDRYMRKEISTRLEVLGDSEVYIVDLVS